MENLASTLPVGWVVTKLKNIAADVSYGYTAKSTVKNIGPHLLRITDIQDGNVNWSSVPFCEINENKKTQYLVEHGDLLFARTGATVGKSFLVNTEIPESVFASYLIRVRCYKGSKIEFMAHFFNSPNYWSQITEFSSGIGQPNVNGTKLKELEIPLAPIAEQKRIVSKLDQLLAQVESIQNRLDKLPDVIKRFRQSVLAAATSGKLTEQWRGTEKSNWFDTTLSGITKSISDGDHQAPPKAENGIPFLVISNVSSGVIELDKVSRWVPITYFESLKKLRVPEKNDILYTVTGSFGIPVLVTTDDKFCFQRHIGIIKPDSTFASPAYLFYLLKSDYIVKQAQAVATGTAQKTVSLKNLRNFNVSVPPLEEQTEIVRLVDKHFSLADTLETHLKNAKAKVDNLTQSILAKAFKGELVPQDPNDEPADKLLERIKAARIEAEVLEKAAKKTAKTKKAVKQKSTEKI